MKPPNFLVFRILIYPTQNVKGRESGDPSLPLKPSPVWIKQQKRWQKGAMDQNPFERQVLCFSLGQQKVS